MVQQCVLANLLRPETCDSDLPKHQNENRELENEENWWGFEYEKSNYWL